MRHKLLLLGLLCVSLQGISQTKDAVLPVDPGVKVGKLPNGLTYYIRKNQEPKNRAEMRLVVNTGSIMESDKQVGLAHFVEHMLFNGTKHFKKNELVNFLEKSGVNFGADLNASTSFDETIYQLQVPTDSPMVYQKALQILEDWAHEASFDHTEIDKERGVIVEEWRLGLGANARLRDKFFPILFKGSQYAKRLPIGTKENIDTAHYNMITSFYKQWYRPDLEAVVIVGDVDVAKTEQMIKTLFSGIPKAVNPQPRVKFGIPAHADTRIAVLTDPEQPYNVIQMYYTQPKLPAVKTVAEYKASIVRDLFNQMMSSRLEELSQKPDAPFLFGSSNYSDFIGDKDAFTLVAVAKDGKTVATSLKALLTENERVRQHGFVQSELDRAKKDLQSRMENAYNERDKTRSGNFVQELIDNYLKGEAVPGIAYEYKLTQELLPTIQLADVNALIQQWIKPTDRSVVVTAPEKEKANLPTDADLLAMLNTAMPKLDAYVDKVSNSPLLPQQPTPGKIVETNTYPALGTTVWTLSNGAKVVLKPTNFKNDEILISAISWGGTSMYPDSMYLNAANASAVASIGGLGTMDIQQLQKYLTGKNCYVGASIAPYNQGISGSSTRKDLPTAMEMLYGRFRYPRKDATMFNVMEQQMKAQLENKDKNPASVFSDSVSYIMGSYHPRRKPFEVSDIARMNQDVSMAVYEDRFKNAGQFVFTFVGSFSLDSIKPLVETYIASLPGSSHHDEWKDEGIRYPKGLVNKTVYKGKEAKASVRLYLTGDAGKYDELEDEQLGQVCEALGIKLREVLREDAGGVYGVGVNGGIRQEPTHSYSIAIQFGCAPENVDKLVKLTMDAIDDLKKNGVSAENLEKVQAEDTRSLENQVKENGYWLYNLQQAFFRGKDPMNILKDAEKIKSLTVDKSKALANKFFNGENLAKLVLLPEKKQ